MKILYAFLKKFWNLIPRAIKGILHKSDIFNAIHRYISENTIHLQRHDDMYRKEYFEMIDQCAIQSSAAVVDVIVKYFNPQTVLDVGCGTGALIQALSKAGINAAGVDGSKEAISLCKKRGLKVSYLKLENIVDPKCEQWDLVTSMEVAEHLPESGAENYVKFICNSAKAVIFTAAVPGQGGTGHINEQLPEYWIRLFEKNGFTLNSDLVEKFKTEWKDRSVASWYVSNLMIFNKS